MDQDVLTYIEIDRPRSEVADYVSDPCRGTTPWTGSARRSWPSVWGWSSRLSATAKTGSAPSWTTPDWDIRAPSTASSPACTTSHERQTGPSGSLDGAGRRGVLDGGKRMFAPMGLPASRTLEDSSSSSSSSTSDPRTEVGWRTRWSATESLPEPQQLPTSFCSASRAKLAKRAPRKMTPRRGRPSPAGADCDRSPNDEVVTKTGMRRGQQMVAASGSRPTGHLPAVLVVGPPDSNPEPADKESGAEVQVRALNVV
jgi:hypothetical protein